MALTEYGGVEVQGLKELGAALRSLPDRVGRNVARGATNAAAVVIRNEARIRAPVYTGPVQEGHPPPGTLKRSIIVKQIPEQSGPLLQTYIVHVRRGEKYAHQGKKNLSQDAYYWTWVEYGTVKMTARPFLRPAFEVKKVDAVEQFKTYLARRLPIEVAALKILGIQMPFSF